MTSRRLTLPGATGRPAETLTLTGDPDLLAAIETLANMLARQPLGHALAPAIVRQLAVIEDEQTRASEVLDAMLPPIETLTDAATTQLRWNAVAREASIREFGAWTSADLAELRGAETRNPHATTSRWVAAGRVFAIETPAGRRFPAFQFEDGEPRPAIARILVALGGRLRGWELLAWFTGSSGYLGGARPVDRLAEAADDVVAAAEYQASLAED